MVDGVATPVAPGFRQDNQGGSMSWVFGREGSAVVVGDVGVAISLKDFGSGVYGYSVNVIDVRGSLNNPKIYSSNGDIATATSPGKVTKRAGAFDFVYKDTLKDNSGKESHLFEVTATLPQ